MLQINKAKNLNQDADGDENEQCISDGDLDNIVGVGDSSGLKVFSFPILLAYLYSTLEINLANYVRTFATGNGNST